MHEREEAYENPKPEKNNEEGNEEEEEEEAQNTKYLLRLHFCFFCFLVQKRTQLKIRSSNRMWYEMGETTKGQKVEVTDGRW